MRLRRKTSCAEIKRREEGDIAKASVNNDDAANTNSTSIPAAEHRRLQLDEEMLDVQANHATSASTQSPPRCQECGETECSPENEFCVAKIIPYDVEKPRPFINLSQSCWINAALQALFSSEVVKRKLAQVWKDIPRTRRKRLLESACRGYSDEPHSLVIDDSNYEES